VVNEPLDQFMSNVAGVAKATSALVELLQALCQLNQKTAVTDYSVRTDRGKRRLKFEIADTEVTVSSENTALIRAIESLIAQQSANALGAEMETELKNRVNRACSAVPAPKCHDPKDFENG
jgi:hypothetical protein